MIGTVMKLSKPLIFIGIAIISLIWPTFDRISGQERPAMKLQSPGSPGYIVHIDPATGEFLPALDRPVAVQTDQSMQNAFSTSSEGLTEQSSPVPGGGIMVNLQGRFQNVFVATIADSNDFTATCKSGDHRNQRDAGNEQ
jgi:hypothetical protein